MTQIAKLTEKVECHNGNTECVHRDGPICTYPERKEEFRTKLASCEVFEVFEDEDYFNVY